MSDANTSTRFSAKLGELRRTWLRLQPREQHLIIGLGAALLIAMVVLLLILPANRAADTADRRLQAKQKLFYWVKANEQAARVAASQGGNPSSAAGSQNILSTVNNLAASLGIQLQRYEPDGTDKLRIWLENESFDNMVRWLRQLESTAGIRVYSISVDAEKEPGLVSGKLVLKN